MDPLQPLIPVENTKNTLVIPLITSTLLTALVVGGGVYAYQKQQSDTKQAELRAELASVRSELREATENKKTPTPTTSPVSTDSPSATPTNEPKLTSEVLNNAEYVANNETMVKLVNGNAEFVFRSGTGKDGQPFIEKGSLTISQIAFGDLTGDGTEDAAVLLSENDGGTGFFYKLVAVTNNIGTPVYSTPLGVLGDRPDVKSLTIKSGVITIDANISGPNDSVIDKSVRDISTYKLVKGKLIKQ